MALGLTRSGSRRRSSTRKIPTMFNQSKIDSVGLGGGGSGGGSGPIKTAKSGILSIPPSEFQTEKDKYYLKSNSKIILQSETEFYSINPSQWIPTKPYSDQTSITHVQASNTGGNSFIFQAAVNIPNGAIVTGAIVYGSAAGETWQLDKIAINQGSSYGVMATANINTQDTTISLATIDNESYSYALRTSIFEVHDAVHGARITYTNPVEADELFINLNLPDNSTITEVNVFGNALATNDDFTIYKVNRSGTATNILGAVAQAIGTARKDITEIVDNENYSYLIQVQQTYAVGDGTWILYGAEVHYIN